MNQKGVDSLWGKFLIKLQDYGLAEWSHEEYASRRKTMVEDAARAYADGVADPVLAALRAENEWLKKEAEHRESDRKRWLKATTEDKARIAELEAALERIRKGGLRHRWKEIEAVAAAALLGVTDG